MSEDRLIRIARAVQGGVCWLRESAPHMTDARALAITATALIAAERNPHSHLVQRLVADILGRQLPDGSWNDELWDTTWAVGALLDAGQLPSGQAVQRAVRFLHATQDPIDGTWYEEPFETMLVLDLLERIAPGSSQVERRALDWLASLQGPDGLVVGTRYTGMAVSLFSRLSDDHQRNSYVVQNGVRFLATVLERRPIWTAASWSNCYALGALLDTGHTLDDPRVARAVDWFLNNQDAAGRWMQVSEVHDTAMATLALTPFLAAPLVDVTPPQEAVIRVSRENGTLRVDFLPPGLGTIVPSERMKLSEAVRTELGANQQKILSAIGRVRTSAGIVAQVDSEATQDDLLKKVGQYTYGHLIPARIQALLENSLADHLRLDIDERLIDLPWELMHDGHDFFSLRYATGRRLVSDQPISFKRHVRARSARDASALVVANPTEDLPAAETEGEQVAAVLRDRCGVRVDFLRGRDVQKKDFLMALREYDLVHYAGHADHDPDSPDESCLLMFDGAIQAFEIARFLKDPLLTAVFLNACWSAEELRKPEIYSPMMRGLGRTFMYAGVSAFIGYLVPVPDESARRFALEFYSSLAVGQSIGESVRRSRIATCDAKCAGDLTWASAVLYGEPTVRVFDPSGALNGG